MAASMIAVSRTVRVMGPTWSSECASGSTPRVLDSAISGFQADDSAERRGLANRPTGIGTECAEAQARGNGGCRPARGSARDPRRNPRIAYAPEVARYRARAIGELLHVELAEQYRASGLEPLDHRSVVLGDPVREQGRGGGGAHAGGIDRVLERDRDPMQRAAPPTARDLGFRLMGLFQGGLCRHRDERIQHRIERIDLRQAHAREFHRR